MENIKKPRVIISEDEPHCRTLIKAVLASMNCDVVGEARTGAEAVELYQKHKPDLMLLDINMPFKTGDEVLQEILHDSPNAVIIMLTSVTDMETVGKCISMGAANFIRKDTAIPEIKKIIRETWSTFRRPNQEQ